MMMMMMRDQVELKTNGELLAPRPLLWDPEQGGGETLVLLSSDFHRDSYYRPLSVEDLAKL